MQTWTNTCGLPLLFTFENHTHLYLYNVIINPIVAWGVYLVLTQLLLAPWLLDNQKTLVAMSKRANSFPGICFLGGVRPQEKAENRNRPTGNLPGVPMTL